MFLNGRKTIGAFISQVNSEFTEALSRGISIRAWELNYNVAFFTNFGGYGQNEYDAGERKISDLPDYSKLDGIILATDTMAVKGLEQQIRNHIRTSSTCPVVSIRRRIGEYYNVLIDDNKVLEDIIRHFITVHGFTKLNFLAGPKGFPDSEKRLACFKRILEEYNIPIEEERIYYGDLWKIEGKKAVDFWMSGSLSMPQAIICANDFMALTVAGELENRGISIPDVVAISGCDDIADSAEYTPALTTARMPAVEMGMEAVDKIIRINQGFSEEQDSYIKTNTIYRASCGCQYNADHEKNDQKKHYFRIVESLQREVMRNAYMSADLTGITTLDEINDRLFHYVYENIGFTDFYMCLHTDWQSVKEGEERSYKPDEEMIMESGTKNRQGYTRVRFSRNNLIPPQFEDDKPLIYYFALLHHRSVNFGYVAIAFEKIQTYMTTFQAWLINVSNALENVRVHSELNRLVYKLEDMYIRDELTGLYNRRGLESLGEKYLKQAVDKKATIMVFTADLDKLKHINDNYGHVGGDIALKAVAEALNISADDDEICVRFGGDEFIVIGLEYDEEKVFRFIRRFIGELDRFNQSGNQEFNVYVSYGWGLVNPDKNTTVEDCLVTADKKMYQQKKEKETLKLRANLIQ
ncbi:MAG: GGDEF domain-containing protein [Clostridiales bacterium]|nr:GGDEF domain-containing protein [Clostridiales bacterium]